MRATTLRSRSLRGLVPTYTPWLAQRVASRCPRETRIVVAARQVGKSLWAAYETIRVARGKPGSTSVVLAPIGDYLRNAIDRMRTFAAELPGVVWKEARKRFEFSNGSLIICLSAESIGGEAPRGPQVNGVLWIDEAALLPEKTYTSALGALVTGNGRVLVTTTPVGKNWVWREFVSDDAENARFRFRSVDSPYTNKARIARIRKKLTAEKAAQDLDAVFVDDLLLAFPDTSRLFVRSLPERAGEKDLRNVIGVDLAKEQDWLVATLMNRFGEARILGRWNHVKWTDTVPRLATMAKTFNATIVLDHGPGSGAGDVLDDFLTKEGVRVLAVKTAVLGTKARIVERCRGAVEWEQIKVVENEHTDQLRHELSLFQGLKRIVRGHEITQYDGPALEDEHDDCVISLCLANWGRAEAEEIPEGETEDFEEYARANRRAARLWEQRRPGVPVGDGLLWKTPSKPARFGLW